MLKAEGSVIDQRYRLYQLTCCSLFQDTMSQAVPSDPEPCSNSGPPSEHAPHADPVQDDSTLLEKQTATLEPSLPTESGDFPDSAVKTAQVEATTKVEAPEAPSEAPVEDQVVECDQAVSLEPDPESLEEEKVCSEGFHIFCFSFFMHHTH